MTRLRVLAGPNANELTPISHLVNTSRAHHIKSDRFDGLVCVHIKGFVAEDGNTKDSAYFNEAGGGDRKGATWSIEVTGRFLVEGITADDVLFGNTFDRPLKLPWGSGAALKFMNLVDPTLEHALDSDKPWALSPLISTMPYFALTKSPHPPKFEENSTPFHTSPTHHLRDSLTALPSSLKVPHFSTPSERRSYFANKQNRQQIHYTETDIVTTDFAYGFLSFPEIRLHLPGGVSFDLMNYWDGQPVRFVCCERKREEEGDSSSASSAEGASASPSRSRKGKNGGLKGPGEPFWVVVFEAVLDDHEEATEEVNATPDEATPGEKENLEDQAHLREDID